MLVDDVCLAKALFLIVLRKEARVDWNKGVSIAKAGGEEFSKEPHNRDPFYFVCPTLFRSNAKPKVLKKASIVEDSSFSKSLVCVNLAVAWTSRLLCFDDTILPGKRLHATSFLSLVIDFSRYQTQFPCAKVETLLQTAALIGRELAEGLDTKECNCPIEAVLGYWQKPYWAPCLFKLG